MDLPIHHPQVRCAVTGRPFVAGETFHAALVRTAEGIARIDVAGEAWTGPPVDALACWRSTYPAVGSAGPTLAPVDALLDALDELALDPADGPVLYLLALHLVRRRVLKVVDRPAAVPAADGLVLACRRRDREYRVPAVNEAEVRSVAVAARLASLVWSGDAA